MLLGIKAYWKNIEMNGFDNEHQPISWHNQQ
jgi:hypothetical protein